MKKQSKRVKNNKIAITRNQQKETDQKLNAECNWC